MSEGANEVSAEGLVDTTQAGQVTRRRHWPEAKKRQMVRETLEPGASVSVVARRHDVNANQLFKWRREILALGSGAVDGGAVLPVRIVPEEGRRPAERAGVIEIAFGCGARVFVGDGVAPAALRQVIDLLLRR
jgi:transposase